MLRINDWLMNKPRDPDVTGSVWYIPACSCILSISCQKNAAAVKMSSCALISHVWVACAESQWRHDPLQSTFEEDAAGDAVGGWLIPRALSYLIEHIHKHWSSRVSGLVWIFRKKNNNTAAVLVKWNITFSCGLYCSFMQCNKLLMTAFFSDSIPWHVTACKLDDEPIHSWGKKTPAFLPSYYLTGFVQDRKLWANNRNTCGYTNKNTAGFLNIPSHLIHNSFLFFWGKNFLSITCRQCEFNAKSQEW